MSGSIKKNSSTTAVTKKEVELSVSKWLSGSRDRDGNRMVRHQLETRRRAERADAEDDAAD